MSLKLFASMKNPSIQHTRELFWLAARVAVWGTDKGLLFFQGKSFVERILEALKPFTSGTFDCGQSRSYSQINSKGKQVNDLWEAAGPLAAIYTGLYHSTSEHNLVVSCDVPLINSRILKLLINENTHRDIVYIENQKSHAADCPVQKTMHAALSRFLNAGERRVMELLQDEQQSR